MLRRQRQRMRRAAVSLGLAEPIVAGVASIPSRRDTLRIVVESILPQIDRLYVFLNGYDDIPEFLQRGRIHVFRSQEYGDQNDVGKYFGLTIQNNGIYFTLDDDIEYPDDYVHRMSHALRRYNYRAAVGVHGVFYPQEPNSFLNRTTFHFAQALEYDVPCSLLGTGTAAFHIRSVKLDIAAFQAPGMADIWFGRFLKEKQIPAIALKRPERWLRDMQPEDSDSIWEQTRADPSRHSAALAGGNPWGAVDITARCESIRPKLKKHVLAALDLGTQAEIGSLNTAAVEGALSGLSDEETSATLRLVEGIARFPQCGNYLKEVCTEIPNDNPFWLTAFGIIVKLDPEWIHQYCVENIENGKYICGDALKLFCDAMIRDQNTEVVSDLVARLWLKCFHNEGNIDLLISMLPQIFRAKYEMGEYREAIDLAEKVDKDNLPERIILYVALSHLHLGDLEFANRTLVTFFKGKINEFTARLFIELIYELPEELRRQIDVGLIIKCLADSDIIKNMGNSARKALVKLAVETEKPEFSYLASILLLRSKMFPIDSHLDYAYIAPSSELREVWLNEYLKSRNLGQLPKYSHEEDFEFFKSVPHISTINLERKNSTKVSIILAAFNAEEFLDYSIESVVNQTHRNIEIIVVDDCSSDRSGPIISKWAAQDDRIIAVRAPQNMGPYACRNIAIERATGEVIAIQDADDASHPERIARQLAALIESDDGAVACLARHIRLDRRGRVRLENHGEVLGDGPMTLMFQRKVVDEIGAFADVRTRGDMQFEGRLRRHYGDTAIVQLDDVLMFALYHPDSNSRRWTRTPEDRRRLLEFRRSFDKDEGSPSVRTETVEAGQA